MKLKIRMSISTKMYQVLILIFYLDLFEASMFGKFLVCFINKIIHLMNVHFN